jgi:Zn finger protein HypA/HybF involved in hydrogenase expression
MATKTIKVTMLKCHCEVCGHDWETRQKPLRCAKCTTPYWDRKKKGVTA